MTLKTPELTEQQQQRVTFLVLFQVTDNISQNTILEYVMINSIFEAILQVCLSSDYGGIVTENLLPFVLLIT